MTRLTCHAHIAIACSGEAIPVIVRRGGEVRRDQMCAPCRAWALGNGADVTVRPEWTRRLGARDETGAVLHPEAVR